MDKGNKKRNREKNSKECKKPGPKKGNPPSSLLYDDPIPGPSWYEPSAGPYKPMPFKGKNGQKRKTDEVESESDPPTKKPAENINPKAINPQAFDFANGLALAGRSLPEASCSWCPDRLREVYRAEHGYSTLCVRTNGSYLKATARARTPMAPKKDKPSTKPKYDPKDLLDLTVENTWKGKPFAGYRRRPRSPK